MGEGAGRCGGFACHGPAEAFPGLEHFREKRTAVFLKLRQAQQVGADSVSGEIESALALSLRFRRATAAVMLLLAALAGDARAEPGCPILLPRPRWRNRNRRAVPAAPQPAQQPALPGVNGVLYLIRSTLLTLNDADRSGNYTVLRDLAAPDFQARYTAADLAASFTDLRRRNFDLYAVALTAPQLTASPRSMPTGCCGSPACFRRGRCRSTSIWCSRW